MILSITWGLFCTFRPFCIPLQASEVEEAEAGEGASASQYDNLIPLDWPPATTDGQELVLLPTLSPSQPKPASLVMKGWLVISRCPAPARCQPHPWCPASPMPHRWCPAPAQCQLHPFPNQDHQLASIHTELPHSLLSCIFLIFSSIFWYLPHVGPKHYWIIWVQLSSRMKRMEMSKVCQILHFYGILAQY